MSWDKYHFTKRPDGKGRKNHDLRNVLPVSGAITRPLISGPYFRPLAAWKSLKEILYLGLQLLKLTDLHVCGGDNSLTSSKFCVLGIFAFDQCLAAQNTLVLNKTGQILNKRSGGHIVPTCYGQASVAFDKLECPRVTRNFPAIVGFPAQADEKSRALFFRSPFFCFFQSWECNACL